MDKQERLINALQKKMGSGSASINVLVMNFKRKYPIMFNLASQISKAVFNIGTVNEPSDEDIDELVREIEKA